MTQSFVFLTRTAIALGALGGIGVMALDGCGPGDTKYYCDSSGCYNCDGYGCHPVTPPTPTKCSGASSCQQNQICTDQGCENICKADADCPQGDVCKSGLCVAATTNPGNPVICSTSSDCGTNQVCVGSGSWAKCVDKTNACTYSSECGGGKVCANGECLSDCSKGALCPEGTQCTKGVCEPTTGTQCTSDAQCGGSTPKCVNGSCEPACGGVSTAACAANEVCENGACVPSTQPQPNCGLGCASNQQCIDGFCRYTCTTPDGNLSQSCELIDTRIGYCAKDSTCRDAQEAQAECLSGSDCTGGKICISNTCQ